MGRFSAAFLSRHENFAPLCSSVRRLNSCTVCVEEGENMAARSALSARRQVSRVSVIVDTSHELSLRIENAKNHSMDLSTDTRLIRDYPWTYLMGMVCSCVLLEVSPLFFVDIRLKQEPLQKIAILLCMKNSKFEPFFIV